MHYWLNQQELDLDYQINQNDNQCHDYNNVAIVVSNPDIEEIYPRLGFNEMHIARTLSIVDNLDEILLTHQGILFPLQAVPKKPMRRKVTRLDNTDSPIFKHPQEHLYDF